MKDPKLIPGEPVKWPPDAKPVEPQYTVTGTGKDSFTVPKDPANMTAEECAMEEWLGKQDKPRDCPAIYFVLGDRWYVDYGNGLGTDNPCLLSTLVRAIGEVK